MDHAGHRAATAGAYIGGGTGDGARSGEAAKQRCCKIGQALGDEFLVRVVAILDRRVGNARRQKGFNGAEQGDGEGRGDQLAERLKGQLWQRKGGKVLGDAIKAGADGFNGKLDRKSVV